MIYYKPDTLFATWRNDFQLQTQTGNDLTVNGPQRTLQTVVDHHCPNIVGQFVPKKPYIVSHDFVLDSVMYFK